MRLMGKQTREIDAVSAPKWRPLSACRLQLARTVRSVGCTARRAVLHSRLVAERWLFSAVMAPGATQTLPRWSLAVPPLALLDLAIGWGRSLGTLLLLVVCAGLAAAVVAAVHHAEVVAHRVGEPFGTLILALAVTVIEVALIVTLMVSGGDDTERWRATPCSRP